MENKDEKKRPTLCVELLNTFSEKELASFNKFLSNDYFNTDKLVVKLFDALKKQVLNITFFDSEVQRKVYQLVFGKLPHANAPLLKKHKNTLNQKLNALLRLAEKFMAVEKLQADEWWKLDYLYVELIKRKQYHLYKRHFNKDIKTIQAEKIKDIAHYENLYKTYWINLEYLAATRKLLEEENINELIEYNDLSYLLKKLNTQIILLSLGDYTKKQYDQSSYEAIEKLHALPQYASNSQLKLALVVINLLKNNTTESYEKILYFIRIHENSLSKKDLDGLYRLALNFCTSEIRKGNFKFYENSFSIHLEMHQKGLLAIQGNISALVLASITTVACRINKYNWAEEINKIYYKYVDISIRKSLFNYNLGIISFFKKDYILAHELFLKVEKTNTSIDLNVRIYILKCLYENSSDYSHYFIQVIRSLKEYLKNQKKTPSQTRQGYLNFTKAILQLYQLKYKKGKLNLRDVESTLKNQTLFSDRVWLIEKTKDLKTPN